jgi:tetratricopeptide (TPR) repeat protein
VRFLREHGDLDGALAAAQEMVRLFPQNANARVQLGRIHRARREYDPAIAAFREAVRLDPQNPTCYPLLVEVLKASGDTDGAAAVAAEFDKTALLAPLCKRAAALLREGKTEDALALLPKIAEARKLHKTPTIASGHALATLGEALVEGDKTTEAEPVLRDCLAIREKLYPAAWETAFTESFLGESLASQKKYEEGEQHLRRAYEKLAVAAISDPWWQKPVRDRRRTIAELLADLYDATGRTDEAKTWRAERAKYDPAPVEKAPTPREVK